VVRELVILRVAALARCDYERVQHEQIAAAVGA
jgi:AhpD family alkylhydroperoxidase